MKESELRTLVRYIITEVKKIIDEDSNTASAGGSFESPKAFDNRQKKKKKKKPLSEKPKKFEPDTTFEPYAIPKPKKTLTEEESTPRPPMSRAETRRQQELRAHAKSGTPEKKEPTPNTAVAAANNGSLWKEVAPPGMEDAVMKLKKKYPKQSAFKIAWSIYNKKK